jgi:hypothetical protein
MFDRFVRQITPPREDSVIRHPFSDYLETSNIVLLGDPGSGKSHLFQKTAETSGGSFLTARAFLNTPSSCLDTVLFIDALDERRAGRGDNSTIDSMVQKLFECAPKQVRISCRAQDWLGNTDLAAFKPYFDRRGGAVVVALEPLSREEMGAILADRGVRDPAAFLEQAYERELDDFLLNPQNLIMLADVVENGNWPKTRRELYHAATELLLQEHSPTRSRFGDGVYTADEMRDAAGVIFAARLIADVEGISLRESDDRSDFPSYRTIGFPDTEKVRAALSRRAFRAGHLEETVDYSHRTTAEYMAAAWLAKKVRAGFPIGRVRALIAVDGCPASELRGIHAWLPVFLPEDAKLLIDADPFGVLTYGDAASLEPSGRKHVLEALGRLAAVDPWFRANNWSVRGLGALAGADMVESFRVILRTEPLNFMLRSVVFDALANGAPLPELEPDLVEVLIDRRFPYLERAKAAQALIKMGESGKNSTVQQYVKRGRSGDEIRLRTNILIALYGDNFGPVEVAEILIDAINCEDKLSIGVLSSLRDRIPMTDIPLVLDLLEPGLVRVGAGENWENTHEGFYTFDRLLLRELKESSKNILARRLRAWLDFRMTMNRFEPIGCTEEIRKELSRRSEALHNITRDFLEALQIDEERLRRFYEFNKLTLGVIDHDDLLDWHCEYLNEVQLETAKEEFLYEMALRSSYRATARATRQFERLWELGEKRPNLKGIKDKHLSELISDWHREHQETIARRAAERADRRAKSRAGFEQHQAEIRSGASLAWLDFLAKIYFCLFADVDGKKTPRERLVSELGELNAEIAIEGFRALLRRDDFPRLEAQIDLRAENKHYTVSYPIAAGLDEEWSAGTDLNSLGDELLKSALTIDVFCLVPDYTDDKNKKRGWKIWLFANRPALVNEVYLAIARSELSRGLQYVEGLHVLLTDEAFAPLRGATTIRLLTEFPNAVMPSLTSLLKIVLECPEVQCEFLAIADKFLVEPDEIGREQLDAWLVTAYLISPARYLQHISAAANDRVEIAWQIRDFIGYRQYGNTRARALSLDQMAEIVHIFARHTSNNYPPLGSSSGDRNPSDAAAFMRSLIDQIAAHPIERATNLLTQMLAHEDLNSYGDHIKHALATQRTSRRDAEYVQPDWRQTVSALFRDRPANVADLHALLLAQLEDIRQQIASSNTDIYRRFWNEDSYGRIDTPKPEESCRDVLVDMLRQRLRPLGVSVEPEGHMVADKRADISVALTGQKILVELKRDYNADVWSAAESQLDRFYTRDPEASGFGIYGVFWFGAKRGGVVPTPPNGFQRPETAEQMENIVRTTVPEDKRAKIVVIVLDVSEPFPKL